jgi:hypothetical protein
MSDYYCLNENKIPVKCDYSKWLSVLASLDRTIKTTTIGRYSISTVFVGVNYPLLFETAIFDDYGKEETKIHARYCTWEEAEKGHKDTVKYIEEECVPF